MRRDYLFATQTVVDSVAALGDPLPSRLITERTLRSLIDLPVKDQMARIEVMLFASESGAV